MSFEAMTWTLKQDDVLGNEKWVLFMLAYRDNPDEPHGCFPSMRRIAKDCGIDKMTVQRCVRSLVKSGKISEEKRKTPKGEPTSSRYTFPQVWLYAPRIQGVRATHTTPVCTTHTELKALKETERKPRVQSRDARNRFDDELHRQRQEAKQKRLEREAEIAMELNVGAAPELVR
jgi:hypothetical protein